MYGQCVAQSSNVTYKEKIPRAASHATKRCCSCTSGGNSQGAPGGPTIAEGPWTATTQLAWDLLIIVGEKMA